MLCGNRLLPEGVGERKVTSLAFLSSVMRGKVNDYTVELCCSSWLKKLCVWKHSWFFFFNKHLNKEFYSSKKSFHWIIIITFFFFTDEEIV